MKKRVKQKINDDVHCSTISLSTLELYNLPSAPDGGYGWVIVLAAFCNNLIADGCTFSFGLIYYELIKNFDASNFKTSFFLSMFNGIPLLFAPVTSLLTERFTCRSIACCGGLLTFLGFFLSYFTTTFTALFLTLGILAPTGLSFLYITSIVMVSKYFDKKRAFATGVAVSGSGMGAILFSPLVSYLIDHYTFRGALLILSAIILHACAFGLLHKPLKTYNIDKSKAGIFQEAYDHFVERVDSMCMKSETLSEISEFITAETNSAIHDPGRKLFKIENISVVENTSNKGVLSLLHNLHTTSNDSECSLANIPIKVSERSSSSEPKHLIKSTRTKSSSSSHYAKQSIHLTGIKPYIPQDRRAIYGSRTVGKHVQVTMETVLDTGNTAQTPHHYVVARSRFHGKFILKGEANNDGKRQVFLGTIRCYRAKSFGAIFSCYPTGYNNLPSYAIENHADNPSLFPLLMGVGNIIGQISLGYTADFECIQTIALYLFVSSVAGISCIVLTFYRQYVVGFIVFSIVFGLSVSANFSLCSVALVDIFGLELLTNTYGLVLFGQGLGGTVGPLIIGHIRDQSNNYDTSFLFAGSGIVFSSVILVPVMVMTNKYLRKKYNY